MSKIPMSWWALNLLFVACLVGGFVYGVPGPRHAAIAMVWLWTILSVLALFQFDYFVSVRVDEGVARRVPRWLTYSLGGFACSLLILHGAWISGLAYLFALLVVDAAASKAEAIIQENQKKGGPASRVEL